MYSGQAQGIGEYDRQIRYLDYMENGVRSKGAGFLKLEKRDGSCSLSLQITGLYRKDHFMRPLLLLAGDREAELCKLQFADGGIKICMQKLNSHNLDGQGLDYGNVTGIRIPITDGKEIRCVWKRQEMVQEDSQKELLEDLQEDSQEDSPRVDIAVKTEPEEVPMETLSMETSSMEETGSVVFDEKWEQLSAIYPHITPFHDEREYLSMGPGDFVILPNKYYKLASNSFLLHGYYNYRHLILARMENKGSADYYIGVPGIFYEREKKVAVLFGFESFECDREPAWEGDFGYYMTPVEL